MPSLASSKIWMGSGLRERQSQQRTLESIEPAQDGRSMQGRLQTRFSESNREAGWQGTCSSPERITVASSLNSTQFTFYALTEKMKRLWMATVPKSISNITSTLTFSIPLLLYNFRRTSNIWILKGSQQSPLVPPHYYPLQAQNTKQYCKSVHYFGVLKVNRWMIGRVLRTTAHFIRYMEHYQEFQVYSFIQHTDTYAYRHLCICWVLMCFKSFCWFCSKQLTQTSPFCAVKWSLTLSWLCKEVTFKMSYH